MPRTAIALLAAALLTFATASGQNVAVIAPDNADLARSYADAFGESLSKRIKVLDLSLASAAFDAVRPPDPFNMSVSEAQIVGSAIGCDYIVLIGSRTQRRASFVRAENYESITAVYLVKTRTGSLIMWRHRSVEAESVSEAERTLLLSADAFASEFVDALIADLSSPRPGPVPNDIERLPEGDLPQNRAFVAPAPYRRVKPEYTAIAALYAIEATVEVEMDLTASGRIERIEVVRWAGYGLDESVLNAVRSMNWRPAERNGKPIAMRVLLRYNFKRIEK